MVTDKEESGSVERSVFRSAMCLHCLQCNCLQRQWNLSQKKAVPQAATCVSSPNPHAPQSYSQCHLTVSMLKSVLPHPDCSGFMTATQTARKALSSEPHPSPTHQRLQVAIWVRQPLLSYNQATNATYLFTRPNIEGFEIRIAVTQSHYFQNSTNDISSWASLPLGSTDRVCGPMTAQLCIVFARSVEHSDTDEVCTCDPCLT